MFTKRDVVVVLCAYALLLIAIVAGLVYTALAGIVPAAVLFFIALISLATICTIFRLKACKECSITSCPFNPRRARK